MTKWRSDAAYLVHSAVQDILLVDVLSFSHAEDIRTSSFVSSFIFSWDKYGYRLDTSRREDQWPSDTFINEDQSRIMRPRTAQNLPQQQPFEGVLSQ